MALQSQEENKQQPRKPHRVLRILLAEDNPLIQRLVVHILEKRGHEVLVANNGLDVLATLKKAAFDLVLMDAQMPSMDGFETTRRIREKEQSTDAHIPIVVLTTQAMKGIQERCLEVGIDADISKPIHAQQLIDVIERLAPVSGERRFPERDTGPAEAPIFDWKKAVARVGGDKEILQEMVALFCEEAPKMLSLAEQAISSGDPKELEFAAHKLKGSVSNFESRPAYEAAANLEAIGREGNLSGARAAYSWLEGQIQSLMKELRALPK